ncbi:MAG: replication restart helicase PriA [Myxococcaceae bacterium]
MEITDSAYARVAVGRPVRGEFTYVVPEALQPKLRAGQRILVPFGRAKTMGFFLGFSAAPSAEVRLRPVEKILDETPALPAELLSLLRFAAEHYRYPLGEAIRGALPPGMAGGEDEKEVAEEVELFARVLPGADPAVLRRAPSQAAALSYLLAVGGRAAADEVAHAIPGARETLRRLEERGFVALEAKAVIRGVHEGLAQSRPAQLTPEQATAVTELCSAVEQGGFAPYLLHGVTGSGKTEVYLRVVERALELGKGSLILVPEIALTPQLVGRFRSRFGSGVAVLHSALKDRDRLRHWQGLRKGTFRIAVGVRSAIFAPVADLGVVVVDEEHDPSFKQEEKLRYQARDLAVVRAKQSGTTVILGSATPSLETLENARRGRYKQVRLSARVDDRPMPTVSIVDLRIERPRETQRPDQEAPVLSRPLLDAMQETLDRGQQVILFLNRRGHSTFLVCEVCGEGLRCSACDVSLTHHLSMNKVMCHYCGLTLPVPEHCTHCRGNLLKLGIGTERVEAEVAARFTKARVARLDRDSASNSEKLTELLAAFARRELDVLVGTQMVAKGHDFPGVTLVCVVMADTSLSIPDFRAAERTFHLLTQVAGRAGRGKDPGRVMVQTYNPESEPVKRVLTHDFDGFSEHELRWRNALAYPPYTRLIAVRIEGEHPGLTAQVATQLGDRVARKLPGAARGVRLLGPAPAPIARIKGKTRWQALLKGPSHAALAPFAAELEASLLDVPSTVKVVIDVDPGAML